MSFDAKYPWNLIVKILYNVNSINVRDEIEKKLSKMGKWIGHGSGFGAHDTQIVFKTEKDADKAKTIAENMMIKYNVDGSVIVMGESKSNIKCGCKKK
jgi:hypothetical protein